MAIIEPLRRRADETDIRLTLAFRAPPVTVPSLVAAVLKLMPITVSFTVESAAVVHSCESCEDCIHDDGAKCCGCYDGACCQEPPVCSCPSGDGSLRWPCLVHPPTVLENRSQ